MGRVHGLRKRPQIVLHYAVARRRGITNDERHSYPLTYEPEIGAEFSPIAWRDGRLLLLDQTRLPESEEWASACGPGEVARAIAGMQVRGAPAIGVAAAYGMALAAQSAAAAPPAARAEEGASAMSAFLSRMEADGDALAAARPTAVNLGWAVRRCLDAARACGSPEEAADRILALARRMQADDVAANRAIGLGGAALLPDSGGVLTHCNTGALATAGYGTALGVIRAAWESGKRLRVFCTETRPWMQGARLTAWEFARLGVPATLIVDSAAGALMASGRVSAVVTGADRIAANGDAANKIGTYALAALAHAHKIPFYVAAPVSTVDFGTPDGEAIPIEERPAEEVTSLGGRRIAAEGVDVWNPAFDVTPARLVSAIITERGVARPPYEASLRAVAERSEMRGAA